MKTGSFKNKFELLENSNVFKSQVLEFRQGQNNSFGFTEEESNDVLEMLSGLKYYYVKNNPKILTTGSTNYTFNLFDGKNQYSFMIYETGVVIYGEKTKVYSIKKSSIKKLIVKVQTIIDKKEQENNYISIKDANYINNTPYKEISFTKIINMIEIDLYSVIIDKFTISLNPDGYLESFNIVYYLSASDTQYTYNFEREYNLTIEEFDNPISNHIKDSNATNILLNTKFLLEKLSEKPQEGYLRLIELVSPNKETMKAKNKDVYYNGEITNTDEVTGWIFTVNDTYSNDTSMKYYVYEN